MTAPRRPEPAAASPAHAAPADAAIADQAGDLVPFLCGDLSAAAVAYAGDRHWEVVPGVSLTTAAGVIRCSCGAARCPLPGAHPAAADWTLAEWPIEDGESRVSSNPARVRRWWDEEPAAAVLLPTGRSFDAIEVSEAAGLLALVRLERRGLPTGAVAASPLRRLYFLVAPGAAERMAGLLAPLGYGLADLDLRCHGDGGFIPAPPTRIGPHGWVHWLRTPEEAGPWLPEARDILGPLAYACALHRPGRGRGPFAERRPCPAGV